MQTEDTVQYTTWPPNLSSLPFDQPPESQYQFPTSVSVCPYTTSKTNSNRLRNLKASTVDNCGNPTGAQVDAESAWQSYQASEPAQTNSKVLNGPAKRKYWFRRFERLAITRYLASEAKDDEMFLRDMQNQGLAAAAEDAQMEALLTSGAAPMGPHTFVPPSPGLREDLGTSTGMSWSAQETTPPRASPASWTSLLSSPQSRQPSATLTPMSGSPCGDCVAETTKAEVRRRA